MMGNTTGVSPIAPVDLAQAAIGPGMAVFSKYSAVLEANGSPMTVRTALQQINKAIDEFFAHAESDMDSDTRFCLDWFQTHGFKPARFGEADVLARAKGTSVEGIAEAGCLEARGGSVRLLRREELPEDWDPASDSRRTVWECVQHLTRRLEEQGERGAAELVNKMGPECAAEARALAYRLYTVCEQRKWAEEARAYNGLVIAWPEIIKLSRPSAPAPEQVDLDLG